MLGHLLASDHLPEALIELLLEKDLRLGLIDEDLTDELSFIHDLVLATSLRLLTGLLGLSSRSLAIRASGEDIVL